MKRVHTLTAAEVQNLDYQYKNASKHHYRIRCQAILLSNEGLSVTEIHRQLKKDKDTIYSWINRYESSGLSGLQNEAGQGMKATLGNLTTEQVASLEAAVADDPQNLNKVSEKLSKAFALKINKRMLIRYLKKN